MTDELMVLLAKASGGKWQARSEYEPWRIIGDVDCEILQDGPSYSYTEICEVLYDGHDAAHRYEAHYNAAAIVAAVNFCRTELPALIAERDALQRDNATLREALDLAGKQMAALRAHIDGGNAKLAERDALREALESPRDTCEAPEVAAMRYIELLRADEGDTVVICCDNPEAETVSVQTAIDCNGFWTDFKDWRFTGESVLQCLAKAVSARAALGASHDAK